MHARALNTIVSPYFTLFLVRGAREREKYVWTLYPAFRWQLHQCMRFKSDLVHSKLSKWLSAYQSVYYSLTIALYDIDFALGFILHRRMTGTSRKCKNSIKTTCSWILKSPKAAAVAALPVGEITDRVHSWDDSFSTCASVIILNELSFAIFCQCGDKLHKTVTSSRMRCFNLHTMRVTCSRWTPFLRGTESWPDYTDVFFSPSRSSHRKKKRKVRVARETSWIHSYTIETLWLHCMTL